MRNATVTTKEQETIATLENLLKVETERRKQAESDLQKAKEENREERKNLLNAQKNAQAQAIKDLKIKEHNEIKTSVSIEQTTWNETFTKLCELIGNIATVENINNITVYLMRKSDNKNTNSILFYGINDGLIKKRISATFDNELYFEKITLDLNKFYDNATQDNNLVSKWNKIYWQLPKEIQTMYTPLNTQKRVIERDLNELFFEDEQAEIF